MNVDSEFDKNNEMILYLDLDGVLVDFEDGAAKFAIYNKEKSHNKDSIEQTIYFWSNLEWIHGGKELWNAASEMFENICILSSGRGYTTELFKAAVIGKVKWVNKNLPSIPNDKIFIVNGKSYKQKYAARESILVDDVSQTIQQWNAKGGFGILHNSSKYQRTIDELEDLVRPIKLSEIVKRFKK